MVDSATWQTLRTSRCAVPDSGEDNGEKFDLFNVSWPAAGSGRRCEPKRFSDHIELTFSVPANMGTGAWAALTSPFPFTQSNFNTAVRNALNVWEADTSIRFKQVTSNACIVFAVPSPMPSSGDPSAIASTLPPPANPLNFSTITIGTVRSNGTGINWRVDTADLDNGIVNLNHAIVHETGHALLLAHSSRTISPFPMMTASNNASNVLTFDDRISVHMSLRTPWRPGFSASSADTGSSMFWHTGTSFQTWGFGIYCNGTLVDGEAEQVAVDTAWVINKDGKVYKRTQPDCGGIWMEVTNAPPLSAIAAAKGQVWGLGLQGLNGPNDHQLFHRDPASQQWIVDPGARGSSITVDKFGHCWHTNQAGEMWAMLDGTNWTRVIPQAGREFQSPPWAKVHAGKDGTVMAISTLGHAFVQELNEGSCTSNCVTFMRNRLISFEGASFFNDAYTDPWSSVITVAPDLAAWR